MPAYDDLRRRLQRREAPYEPCLPRQIFQAIERRRTAANLITKDEAQWIAANIVKLPGLLRR